MKYTFSLHIIDAFDKNINAQKSYLILVVKSSSKQKAGLTSVKFIIQVVSEWSVVRALIGHWTLMLGSHWS